MFYRDDALTDNNNNNNLFTDYPGLLEQPLDFYEPGVLPANPAYQPIALKHTGKRGRLLFLTLSMSMHSRQYIEHKLHWLHYLLANAVADISQKQRTDEACNINNQWNDDYEFLKQTKQQQNYNTVQISN